MTGGVLGRVNEPPAPERFSVVVCTQLIPWVSNGLRGDLPIVRVNQHFRVKSLPSGMSGEL